MLHDLYVHEKKSLQALKLFVGRANEILNLWKVLYDHQFHLVAVTLSAVRKFLLLNLIIIYLFLKIIIRKVIIFQYMHKFNVKFDH